MTEREPDSGLVYMVDDGEIGWPRGGLDARKPRERSQASELFEELPAIELPTTLSILEPRVHSFILQSVVTGQRILSHFIGSIEQCHNVGWRYIGLKAVAARKNIAATRAQGCDLSSDFLRDLFGLSMWQDGGIRNVRIE
jgi:hypothetical protein